MTSRAKNSFGAAIIEEELCAVLPGGDSQCSKLFAHESIIKWISDEDIYLGARLSIFEG